MLLSEQIFLQYRLRYNTNTVLVLTFYTIYVQTPAETELAAYAPLR